MLRRGGENDQAGRPRRDSWATPWVTAWLFVAGITIASYPGFMSFDSLDSLRQARTQVEGSQYPPFGSYVWRVLDWIWPGPTLMQLVQNALLLTAFTAVLALLKWRVGAQVLAISAVCLLPGILGTMLVVWKDVAVGALYMAGFAMLLWARTRSGNRAPWLAAAVFFIFCGMAYRFNAASGALPLLVYACWLAADDGRLDTTKFGRALLQGTVLVVALFSVVWVINSFRFPSFERLERNTNIDYIRRFDLVGIGRYAEAAVVPGSDGKPVEVAYLKRIYDPRHVHNTFGNDVRRRVATMSPAEIEAAWLAAVKEHPLAYLRHRAEVLREYIGLHGRDVFYVTHPVIDPNPFGLVHRGNGLTDLVLIHMWQVRDSVLNRSWIYYLAAIAAAVAMVARKHRFRTEAVVACSSSLLYLAPMFFITPAGDLRYNFWSLWGAILTLLLAITPWVAGRPEPAGPGSPGTSAKAPGTR